MYQTEGQYLLKGKGVKWQMFGEVERQLLQSGSWMKPNNTVLSAKINQQFHLHLVDRGKVNRNVVVRQSRSNKGLAMINYILGYKAITDKTDMMITLWKYAAKYGLDFSSWLPDAFLVQKGIPFDYGEFCNYLHDRQGLDRNIWIAKSSNGAKGADLKVSTNPDALLDFIEARPKYEDWIIQKYLEDPLLVDGRKFDIRVWVRIPVSLDETLLSVEHTHLPDSL